MELSQRAMSLTDSSTLKINSKAKLLLSKGKDVINFSAGEPDFDTPEIIKEEAKKAIDNGYTKYTPVSGIAPLRQAIVKRYRDKFGIEFSENSVLVSCGAKQSLSNIVETICDPGDEVIIPVPYWLSYPEIVKIALAKPVFIDTLNSNYLLTPDNLEKAITEKTKLLILNSPSNPTGTIYPASLLKELAYVIKEHNIFCLSDEIYDELIYTQEKYDTMLSFTDSPLDFFAVVNGVSKTFSMTGWRLGYCISSQKIISKAIKIQAHTTSCASSISQYAALAALQKGKNFTKSMREEFNKRRKLVTELLSQIDNISFPEPQGAFYIFIKVSKYYNDEINTSVSMAEYLLDEYKVALVPGSSFGDDSYLRLSYTLSVDKLRQGIERIKTGLLNVRR
jgi:aspartate aminotransferase